jgi:AraC family transcriptional regulator
MTSDINPRLEILSEMKLTGKKMQMCFSANKTFELWRSFMPDRLSVKNKKSDYLYSVEVYPSGFFSNYNPDNIFEKWAAIEVTGFDEIPANMETLTVPSGLYAVFIHKGPASKGPETYQYIFMDWLPASDYQVDNRPHFAVMGEKYKHEAEDSEEEIWIPVKPKS